MNTRLLAAVVLLSACATEPPPLDRTQPEAVPKAIFQGEWIYKATVTDTDPMNIYTFIGEETTTYTGQGFKVRWEVTQDLLNAYRIPQRWRDTAGNLVNNAMGSRAMILSFKIKKHYDIRYRYNSTTREELNVIEENEDRPWNEREYMEIDWSQNLVTNISDPTMELLATGEIVREPVSVYENVEFFARGATPDADVRIDTRRWDAAAGPEVYAMNIDVKEVVTTKVDDWYQIYYGTYMEPVTVKLRHSLMRSVPPAESTYQPRQYTDEAFRRYGYFRTEYEVWDPERNSLENRKRYLINRWDLSPGKRITWYASPSFQEQIDAGDAELRGYAERIVAEWNKVLKEATGRTDDPMEFRPNAPLLGADGKQVVNPDGTKRWVRELGDLRWSFLNFTTKAQDAAPLGYGPSTPDSDSGELVNGTVNVYGDWIDWVVRRVMDQYDVAAGNCTLDQVAAGNFFDPATGKCDSPVWAGKPAGGVVKAKLSDGSGASAASAAAPAATPVAMRALTPALKTSYWPKSDPRKPARKPDPQRLAAAGKAARKQFEWRMQHPAPLDAGRFGVVAGTRFESMMVPSASLHSLLPFASAPDDARVASMLSPARRLDPSRLWAAREERVRRSALRDEPVMFEPAIHAFVDDMKDKPRDEVYRRLREWVWYTSTLHEMGHALGLRHNFRGSADERNFPPEYAAEKAKHWDAIEALRAQYQPKIDAGDPDAYEAYVAAVDDLPAKHHRWASTSIMDYLGDWTDWQYPVGSYDRAAILFGYGNKVEVRDAPGAASWTLADYKDGDFRTAEPGADPYDDATASASGRLVRSYLFCSDEKVFDDLFCSMFDTGTTATEITRNFIRDSQPSYFFKNFKRQATAFESRRQSYYIDKWLDVYYMRAKVITELELSSMRYGAMWDAIWDAMPAVTAGPEARDLKPGWHPDGGEDLLRATLLFYYWLLYDVLGRPDYGYYQLAWDTSGQRYWDFTEERYLDTSDEAPPYGVVPAGVGWGWDDRWDAQDDVGTYYAHLQRIGVEMDKIVALEILSVPAILNEPLWWEKANGLSFWNSLWTGDGHQLWDVIRGIVTDNVGHLQNPWCMKCDAKCMADPVANPPLLRAYPVGYDEALAKVLDEPPDLGAKLRCGPDEYPMRPAMDALFAIYPIYYGIAGASHPWYQNGLMEHMDSQVVGGNHRFDPPKGAKTTAFVNGSGTKTYQAVETEDGKGISYRLVQNGRRIRQRIDMVAACDAEVEPPAGLAEAVGRTCDEVLSCYYCMDEACTMPDWCGPDGWDWTYLYPGWKWSGLDRIEAMLIMMQDMIDLAGHYQWEAPEIWGEEDSW
ncbi:MAG: hypothetical protein FJ087_16140 [Deltaproteobacteria bacterium]|nr:hypothetical protein [Deltaproteobacteria bacterium]